MPLMFGSVPPRRLSRRVMIRLALLAAVAVSVSIDRSALLVVGLIFVLVVPFEKLFPRHRGQRIRRPLVATDISYALVTPLLTGVGIAASIVVGVVSLAWLPGLALRPLVSMLPAWSLPLVGIALFDLAIYWVHRWSHEVPFLWRFHSVHHSTEHLDWISGFRNHPLDGAIVAPPFFFLLAAGFEAEFASALAIVQIVSGLFLHANVRWRLAPLHRVIITPEFHHWHHANESDAHNSNYSVFLPLWDIVFGTYFMPKDRRPERYGIDGPMPSTLLGQLRQPLVGLGSPRAMLRGATRHPLRSLRVIRRAVWRLVADIVRSTRRSTRAHRT